MMLYLNTQFFNVGSQYFLIGTCSRNSCHKTAIQFFLILCITKNGNSIQVSGVQQTYHQFHHEAVPHLFTSQLTIPYFMGRMLVGIPTILIVKFCSKALAKWILPVVANTLGIPIKSTTYLPMLNGSSNGKKSDGLKQSGYLQKLYLFSSQDSFDVDTGIRFIQYAGLAWSVVDLVPSLFSQLSL